MSESKPTCWIVTEGLTGTENPCIGLAEAAGLQPVIKRVKLKSPWKELSPWLFFGHGVAARPDSSDLSPPYPDILITSGRKSIGMGWHIKALSGGKTFHVHVQNPQILPSKFDLIIASEHDGITGKNIVTTKAGMHKVTKAVLEHAYQKFQKTFETLARPRIAVLIGGSTKDFEMTADATNRLISQLKNIDGGLMTTASRRTGEANMALLKKSLSSRGNYFWDGTGENPYFGLLAHANYIIVTEDSVSMVSEALATGKPVLVASLNGTSRRIGLFHRLLQQQGFTRPFTGRLEQWSYTPPDDTHMAAQELLKRYKERK